jgi:hypothetical protein
LRLDPGQIEVLDDAMAEVLKRKTPWERIAIGFELWHGAWEMLRSHVSASHPDWSDEEILAEVARRMSHGAA